jgi:tRNA U34 5-carboxymethylaminomethyl modifying GTPase MnmE/TrmE
LETLAAAHGFTGSPTDELPEEIEKAIANGSKKILGAAPPTEPQNENIPATFNPKDLSNASQAEQSTYENHRRATRNLALEKARLEGQLEAIEEHQAKSLAKAQTKAELNREEQIKLLSENKEMIADFKSHSEHYRGETLNVYATVTGGNKDLEKQIAEIKSFAKQSRYWENN